MKIENKEIELMKEAIGLYVHAIECAKTMRGQSTDHQALTTMITDLVIFAVKHDLQKSISHFIESIEEQIQYDNLT